MMEKSTKTAFQTLIAPYMVELLCNKDDKKCILFVNTYFGILELLALIFMLIGRILILQTLWEYVQEVGTAEEVNEEEEGGEVHFQDYFIPNGHVFRAENNNIENDQDVQDEVVQVEVDDDAEDDQEYNQEFRDVADIVFADKDKGDQNEDGNDKKYD